jgi:hypothetical protein
MVKSVLVKKEKERTFVVSMFKAADVPSIRTSKKLNQVSLLNTCVRD